jgi:hypothetical protein
MNMENSRQTTLKEFGLVFLVAVMLSGCAGEIIPDPPSDDDRVIPNSSTLEGSFTVLVGDENATKPTITLGNSTTWLEVISCNYTVTHLSFTVDNNTVTFHNYTFEVGGYVSQNITYTHRLNADIIYYDYLWSSGYAPSIGTVDLYFSDFTYDITINYTITYREWRGTE